MLNLGKLEKSSVLVTIFLGLNTLWNDHISRKRNRELEERDRKIRELEDRIRAMELSQLKTAKSEGLGDVL